MKRYDENGIWVKPDHTGVAGPSIGETVWLVVRHDDKMFGPFSTRHDAAGYAALLHDCDDFEMKPVTLGTVRMDDVVAPEKGVRSW